MIEPYCQDDYVTLYNADFLQHLDMLDQADVMVTDPPYGINFVSGASKYNGPSAKIHGDMDTMGRDAVVEARGVALALLAAADHAEKEETNA